MSATVGYKCPSCGAPISFDSAAQKMKCEYCDSQFDAKTLEDYRQALEAEEMEPQPVNEWSDEESADMVCYICNSCGGAVITDKTTSATHCAYCNSPVVISQNFAGGLRPDYVIPFKLDKAAAEEGLKKHMLKKPLLPKVFKDENHIKEIKGIYVPHWLFDAHADAEITYKGQRVSRRTTSNYIYITTSYYSLYREGSVAFEAVPADSSSKMPDDLSESLEPYNLNELTEFHPAYLSGYLADRYDVTREQCSQRARERIKSSAENAIGATISGYTGVKPEKTELELKNTKASYALYPAWILTTEWNGQNYTFAMNGQTGKFVGDLPVDKKKYTLFFLLFMLAFSVAAFLLMFLLPGLLGVID